MGKRVVILSRGYRRQSKELVLVASDGKRILPWKEIGDEPAMMAHALPGTAVIVGANRVQTGQLAIERFTPDVLLLDDAYQHIAIQRDLNILVIDATNPFGNRHVLPGGILRESLKNLVRADAFLLTRVNQADSLATLTTELEQFGKPVFQAVHHPAYLMELNSGRKIELDKPVSKKCMIFSGIGSPAAFRKTIQELNYTLVGEKIFPDHHPYLSQDMQKLNKQAAEKGADYLITTEKDAVRLPKDYREGIWVLGIHLQIIGNQADWEKLIGKVLSKEI